MLAAKFVESEIKRWLEESRPSLNNPLEYLPQLAYRIISAYEEYKRETSVKSLPHDKEDPYMQVKKAFEASGCKYPFKMPDE